MKKFKLLWTKQAAIDLDEIVDFVFLDRPSAALRLAKTISANCSKLRVNPERARVVREFAAIGVFNYREIIIKPYRVIFKLTSDAIYVIAVIDSRRDIEALLFRRLLGD